MKKVLFFLLLSGLVMAQSPSYLVRDCSLKVESFLLSREIFPSVSIGAIRNHSLRGRDFIGNLYQLFISNLSDYIRGGEGIIGFDSSGGFFSPLPGYDYLLRITYQEIGGEAHIYIKIYNKEGKFEDLISCSQPVEKYTYREFESAQSSKRAPILLWEAEIGGEPLAAYRRGENILVLYEHNLVSLKKRGGFLVRVREKSLSWPKPLYPSLDLRGKISSIRIGGNFYLALGISSSSNYIYLDSSDFSVSGELPWLPVSKDGEKFYLGKFSPGENFFQSEIKEISSPQSIGDLSYGQKETIPEFYDMCVLDGMLNIIDKSGRRRIFKGGEEIPSADEKMGDEIECWGNLFAYTGFGDREFLSFRDSEDFSKKGETAISGKIIDMKSEGGGIILVLVEDGGRYWIKEFRIE